MASRPGAPSLSYVTSKHALVGLTKELAVQWAKTGVTVNAIAPAYFPSEMVPPELLVPGGLRAGSGDHESDGTPRRAGRAGRRAGVSRIRFFELRPRVRRCAWMAAGRRDERRARVPHPGPLSRVERRRRRRSRGTRRMTSGSEFDYVIRRGRVRRVRSRPSAERGPRDEGVCCSRRADGTGASGSTCPAPSAKLRRCPISSGTISASRSPGWTGGA